MLLSQLPASALPASFTHHLSGLPYWHYVQWLDRDSSQVIAPERLIALVGMVLGALLRLVCYNRLKKSFTFELSLREDHKLITDGPYSVVRHPSYSAGFILLWGGVVFFLGRGSWWAVCGVPSHGPLFWLGASFVAFAAAFMYSLFPRCTLEDGVLREHFKEEWYRWKKGTPYRMVPFIF